MHRGLEHEIRMSVFAVLAQTFSVIGSDDDYGSLSEAEGFQISYQPADLAIDITDFGMIRAVGDQFGKFR